MDLNVVASYSSSVSQETCKSSRSRIVGVVALFFTMALLASALWAEILLYSQNTLYLNDEWLAGKRQREMGVMGGDQFLLSRDVLARKTLHLGAWYGFQDVELKQPLRLRQASFHFQVPKDSYLDFTFGHREGAYSGLRFSRAAYHHSIAFESSEEGGFIRKTLLPVATLDEGWHRAFVLFNDRKIQLRIDGEPPVEFEFEAGREGLIGFRGSFQGALVDDIILGTADGREIRPTFGNRKKWAAAVGANAAFFSLLALLYWLRNRKRRHFAALGYHGVAVTLLALVLGGLWYGFDFYYWSPLPVEVVTHALTSEKHSLPTQYFELLRFRFFSAWYQLVGGEVITTSGVTERGYPANRYWQGPIYCGPQTAKCGVIEESDFRALIAARKKTYRILFIGTSQTVGACAQKIDHTFFLRTHHLLSAALAPARVIESLNMSVSASDSGRLYDQYVQHYAAYAPDLVVINLSVNDTQPGFGDRIGKFLQFNRRKGIRTVLLEEATLPGFQDSKELLMHRILREQGQANDVPVLPLHDFLYRLETEDTGIIWCDMVHLSSYGQDRTARWLTPKLLDIIQNSQGSPLDF